MTGVAGSIQSVRPRPFRFAVQLPRAASRAEWIEKVQRAEAHGFDVISMPDHFSDQFGPFAALSAAAAATTRVRLGMLVIDNDFRHPAVLAKELATLDVLSEGRVEIGLGAGWRASDYEPTGIPFEPAGVRVGRLEEGVQVLRGLMGDGPFTFAGRHYRIGALDGQPKPVQRPAPPILIGGSRKRILGVAARHADIVGMHIALDARAALPHDGATMTAAAMREQLGWLRDAAPGRFADLELHAQLFFVALDATVADVAQDAQKRLNLPAAEASESPHILFGSLDNIVEQLESRRTRYGLSFYTVSESNQTATARVIAKLRTR